MNYVVTTNSEVPPLYRNNESFVVNESLIIGNEMHYRAYSYQDDVNVWIPASHIKIVSTLGEKNDSQHTNRIPRYCRSFFSYGRRSTKS